MAEPWMAPRLWPGATVVCAAPGPSLDKPVWDKLRATRETGTVRVIAVGDAYRPLPWADLIYHADAGWWHLHWERAGRLSAPKVTVGSMRPDGTLDRPLPYRSVLCLRNSGRDGFDPDPGCLRTGDHSGYQALHLAAHLGARKVLLVGYDMRKVGGRSHYFGEHPAPLTRDSPYERFAGMYKRIAGPLRERGVEVINCTPESAVPDFPFKALDDALGGLVEAR